MKRFELLGRRFELSPIMLPHPYAFEVLSYNVKRDTMRVRTQSGDTQTLVLSLFEYARAAGKIHDA